MHIEQKNVMRVLYKTAHDAEEGRDELCKKERERKQYRFVAPGCSNILLALLLATGV